MDKFEKLNKDAKRQSDKVEAKQKKINQCRSKSINNAEKEGNKFFDKIKKL